MAKEAGAVWASSKYTLTLRFLADPYGRSLATAEMHMALATLLRYYDFRLFETDRSDVELAHDFFLPSAKLDSKGVRVKVTKVEE